MWSPNGNYILGSNDQGSIDVSAGGVDWLLLHLSEALVLLYSSRLRQNNDGLFAVVCARAKGNVLVRRPAGWRAQVVA